MELRGYEPYPTESCIAEISPRGSAFSLLMLGYGGHPTHLTLIDAHLRGEVRVGRWLDHVGDLAYGVAAGVLAPLVVGYADRRATMTLRDWTHLPPQEPLMPNYSSGVAAVWSGGERPIWIRCGERDPAFIFLREWTSPTFIGNARPPWRDVVVSLPIGSFRQRWDDAPPVRSISVVLSPEREPESLPCTSELLAALRRLAYARSAQVQLLYAEALDGFLGVLEPYMRERRRGWLQLRPVLEDALHEARWSFRFLDPPIPTGVRGAVDDLPARVLELRRALSQYADEGARDHIAAPLTRLGDVAPATLVSVIEHESRAAECLGVMQHKGLSIDVALVTESDGGAMLSLLPPVEEEPTPELVGRMEAAAREVLALLMGVPFAEERKEEIAHRLVGPERTTTLLVGWSLVLPRNRRVFAAWLGSDGRVMIRLFPPEGRPARGRA